MKKRTSKPHLKMLSLLLALILVLTMQTTIYANGLTHKVKSGESWWSISQQYGVNYIELARANGRTASQHIYTGETLVIPGKTGSTPTPTPKPPTSPQPTQAPTSGNLKHTVVRGESWWSIGVKYGVSYTSIASANNRSINSTIYVGEVLTIPGQGGTTPAPTTAPKPTTMPQPTQAPNPTTPTTKLHTVKAGESWWSIAQVYKINYVELAKANGKSTSQYIFVGESLIIPGIAGATPTPVPGPTTAPTPAPQLNARVITVNQVSDPAMSAEAGTYKIIMAPNTVTGINPGIGLGMMIKTPNNKTIVLDGGMQQMVGDSTTLATGEGSGELQNMKSWLLTHANNTVDAWIVSHPHNDHARVPSAIVHEGQVQIRSFYAAEYPKNLHDQRVGDETPTQSAFVYDAYNKMKQAGKYQEITAGMSFSIDGVTIEFLNGYNSNLWLENNSSAVVRLTFEGSSAVVLLLADIQDEAAKLLMQRYPNKLKADMVQMSHHGLDALPSLYQAIAAPITFVPAGGAQVTRGVVVQNTSYLSSQLGSTNYFADQAWQILEIRR